MELSATRSSAPNPFVGLPATLVSLILFAELSATLVSLILFAELLATLVSLTNPFRGTVGYPSSA